MRKVGRSKRKAGKTTTTTKKMLLSPYSPSSRAGISVRVKAFNSQEDNYCHLDEELISLAVQISPLEGFSDGDSDDFDLSECRRNRFSPRDRTEETFAGEQCFDIQSVYCLSIWTVDAIFFSISACYTKWRCVASEPVDAGDVSNVGTSGINQSPLNLFSRWPPRCRNKSISSSDTSLVTHTGISDSVSCSNTSLTAHTGITDSESDLKSSFGGVATCESPVSWSKIWDEDEEKDIWGINSLKPADIISGSGDSEEVSLAKRKDKVGLSEEETIQVRGVMATDELVSNDVKSSQSSDDWLEGLCKAQKSSALPEEIKSRIFRQENLSEDFSSDEGILCELFDDHPC